MRPVERGPWPQDVGTAPKVYRPYSRAKGDLLSRLGQYCCYCERVADLHVEHVVPKSRRPELEEDWTNLLLACVNCNATKRDKNESRDGYLWPDQDDTEAAFEYLRDGIVRVRDGLPGATSTKARELFGLVGLGRRPGPVSDQRWRKRREAWSLAEEARSTFEKVDDAGGKASVVDLVVKAARSVGFWSVWMAVFSSYPHICERLREAFVGTASLVECGRRRAATQT